MLRLLASVDRPARAKERQEAVLAVHLHDLGQRQLAVGQVERALEFVVRRALDIDAWTGDMYDVGSRQEYGRLVLGGRRGGGASHASVSSHFGHALHLDIDTRQHGKSWLWPRRFRHSEDGEPELVSLERLRVLPGTKQRRKRRRI
jgi:hypothetical protein